MVLVLALWVALVVFPLSFLLGPLTSRPRKERPSKEPDISGMINLLMSLLLPDSMRVERRFNVESSSTITGLGRRLEFLVTAAGFIPLNLTSGEETECFKLFGGTNPPGYGIGDLGDGESCGCSFGDFRGLSRMACSRLFRKLDNSFER